MVPKKSKSSKRPGKLPDLMNKIRESVVKGRYLDTRHSSERQNERGVTRLDYTYVLKTGYHEPSKDEFKEEYDSWNYSIRGKTVDGKQLRVIVAFLEPNVLIITVIDLDI